MRKRYTLCMVNGAISEWLGEADTMEEAEMLFDVLKARIKTPSETLVIGESETGRWVKKWPEDGGVPPPPPPMPQANPEDDSVEFVELKYFVATKATDGKWYTRAAFSTEALARAYATGLAAAGVDAKAVW